MYRLAKSTINAISIIIGRVIIVENNLYNALEGIDNMLIEDVITTLYISNK